MNIEKTNVLKSWIFKIRSFVLDHRQKSRSQMFKNLGLLVIQVFVFDYKKSETPEASEKSEFSTWPYKRPIARPCFWMEQNGTNHMLII